MHCLDEFAMYLRAERGAAENTVSNYVRDVEQFDHWLNQSGKTLAGACRADIQEYLSWRTNHDLSPRSVRRKLATLRTFYRLLLDDGAVTINPAKGVPQPKIASTLPKVLSGPDVNKMVRWAGHAKRRGGIGVRDKAVLLTLYASGLRESELINLKLADVDFESGFVKVWNGKGGKDGIAPLSPPAIDALKRYIRILRPKLDPESKSYFLFLNSRRRKISRQSIFYMVRDVGRGALGKDVTPHQFRHSCATALIRGGADIRDVQALLRHSDINTTQIYVHTDVTYLRRIYEQSHPRA